MRNIKFRVWDKEYKKMFHFQNENDEVEHCSEYNTLTFDWNWKKDGARQPGFGDLDMSYKNTELMQFTGIKDKKENEIYEGDIILVNVEIIADTIGGYSRYETEGKILPVIFYEGSFGVNPKDNSFVEFMPLSSVMEELGEMEIIGNSYETPELLK